MIGVLEGDSSPLEVGESSIIMGTIEDCFGFPVFTLVLFLALKYMEACLFLLSFGLIGVLKAMSATTVSLSKVSGDTSIFSTSFVSSFSTSSSFSSSILVSSPSFSFSAKSSLA